VLNIAWRIANSIWIFVRNLESHCISQILNEKQN
jgi:hypothetical protein